MHIFMFDSFQLLFDLLIFCILRMVITGSAKLVVTLKTTAFSVHSCLTQNVTSLLGGIHFKWSLEHNFCLTSLTSSPSRIISGFGRACVFNLTSFSWNAILVLCHISKATCHHTSLNFFHCMPSCTVVNYHYDWTGCNYHIVRPIAKLDLVGSTVRYEVMRLCSVYWVSIWQQW